MRRINTATKGKITDQNGKSFDGFVERDPREGEQSTHLSDNWCNNLQEEICNVIEGVGGQIVSGSDVQVEKYDQMFQAIKLLVDTATPIGSVKAMPIKMSDSYMARWVQAAKTDSGAVYLSQEMATNCEKVEGNTEGWYKLVTGNKENGEGSGAFGWALADGTFPLPISSFGEDDGTRPETEEEKNRREYIISDTEYGKIWAYNNERGLTDGRNKKGWNFEGISNIYAVDQASSPHHYPDTNPNMYLLQDNDLISSKNHTPIDLSIWTANNTEKPKLIPNLNDKTFLMGSDDPNLTVEGKNSLMMQPHHMPPHQHNMTHSHTATCSTDPGHYHLYNDINSNSGNYDGMHHCDRGKQLDDGGYRTDPGGAHSHTITVGRVRQYTSITGGYLVREYKGHNEGGHMQGKALTGSVPIDIRPKRMTVHYYIRVI